MQHTIQTFPAVDIEALPSGLFRLEDNTCQDGAQVIDLHPAQVQVLAMMVGVNLPDKSRAALARISSRLRGLHEQAQELRDKMQCAVHEQNFDDLIPEMVASEFIAHNVGELLEDLDALRVPDLEPVPDATANPGGQLTLPV
jgi:hypothetical protein